MAAFAVGDLTPCMCVGHLVDARVVRILTEADGINAKVYRYEMEFLNHHDSGAKELCLDFGQKWNIREGERFLASDGNIFAARKLMKRGA